LPVLAVVEVLDVPFIDLGPDCCQLEHKCSDVFAGPPMGSSWAGTGDVSRLCALDYNLVSYAVIGATEGYIPLTCFQYI
jgi:hypothetical protein